MRDSKGLVTTAEALRRVFLPPLQQCRIASLSAERQSPYSSPQCLHHPPPPYRLPQHRYFTSTGLCHRWVAPKYVTPKYLPGGGIVRTRPDRPPRDEEIKASRVYLVNPEDGKLSEPISPQDILDSREKDEKGRPTQYLQEVAPVDPKENRHFPICKLFDRKRTLDAVSTYRKTQKEHRKPAKQLEVSWTIDDNDLAHRLGKLKEFLEKGHKVELIFGAKRKGWNKRRGATEEEITRVLERIKGAVAEVEGAKEWKPMLGKIGGPAVFSFERKAKE